MHKPQRRREVLESAKDEARYSLTLWKTSLSEIEIGRSDPNRNSVMLIPPADPTAKKLGKKEDGDACFTFSDGVRFHSGCTGSGSRDGGRSSSSCACRQRREWKETLHGA